jgi:hypothetical protein
VVFFGFPNPSPLKILLSGAEAISHFHDNLAEAALSQR